jgi:hypothetical protein
MKPQEAFLWKHRFNPDFAMAALKTEETRAKAQRRKVNE